MWAAVGGAALAYVQHGGQSGNAGDVVHYDAAGEIEHAPFLEHASTPNHVDEREIDEGQPSGKEQHVRLERDAIGERAGDERRSDNGEHHLIGDEDKCRDGVVWRGRAQVDSAQECVVEVADDAVPVAAEAERIAVEKPDHRRPAHGDEALNHDGEHVLASHQAAIKEGEAGRHQHDQAAAQNHETRITSVEMQHRGFSRQQSGSARWG